MISIYKFDLLSIKTGFIRCYTVCIYVYCTRLEYLNFNTCTPSYVIDCLTCMHEKSKIPFSYMLYAHSVKEPIGELNLKRALDEDTAVFSSILLFPSFIFFSTGSTGFLSTGVY